jgi:hypothetical protein
LEGCNEEIGGLCCIAFKHIKKDGIPRLPSDTSSSQTSLAREVRETLGEVKKSLISDLKVVSDRLHALKSRSGAPVEPFSSNQCRQEEDDSLRE